MRHGRLSLSLAVFVGLLAGRAEAVLLTPLSQERYVQASTQYTNRLNPDCAQAGELPCSDSASATSSAPDFGEFDATVSPECTFLSCPEVVASQHSIIGPNGITMSAFTGGAAFMGHSGLQAAQSSARTYLFVSFHIDRTVDFEFEFFRDTVDNSDITSEAYAYLAGPGGLYVNCDIGLSPWGCAFAVEENLVIGTLPPGDFSYEIIAYSEVTDFGETGAANSEQTFSVELRLIPEPLAGLLVLQGLAVTALVSRRSARVG